jgi:hypothetical protein
MKNSESAVSPNEKALSRDVSEEWSKSWFSDQDSRFGNTFSIKSVPGTIEVESLDSVVGSMLSFKDGRSV